jgi:hypothetical protein
MQRLCNLHRWGQPIVAKLQLSFAKHRARERAFHSTDFSGTSQFWTQLESANLLVFTVFYF